ncbi:Class I heat shock protein [Heracleum sosnowskyi]|uniref:Class I heat shock protein n=1 Tax=Heracleum sosnowskyi TaxID=360622 RepID=A0AAD8HTH8_9APIA|nr:Class I heat shock protein [Heracleum sosnowskyi]
MKIHPSPKKRNITLRYNIPSNLPIKKLRRLPHIFEKVLELPFHSDADVSVQETSESLRFIVITDDDFGQDVRAQTVEIFPGVTKIVVRRSSYVDLSEFGFDLWRFRLPEDTKPELATAVYSDGELVVIVPKEGEMEGGDQQERWGDRNGRLLLVQ